MMSQNRDSANLISRAESRRAWRLVSIAGALGMIYSQCIQSAPFTGFLKEIGFSDPDFAILSTIGSLALFFQIASGHLGSQLQNRKRTWMLLIVAARMIVILLLAAPLFDEPQQRVYWVLSIIFVYHALDNLAQPIWFSWMADLVPKETLSRHWATRQRLIHGVRIIVMLAVTAGAWYFERTDNIVRGFFVLAFIAVISGLIDLSLFRTVPDPPSTPQPRTPFLQMLRLPLRDKVFRPLLVFLCCWKFAISLSMPLVQIFILRHLGMSVTQLQILITLQTITTVASSRFWGIICDALGHRTAIQLSAFGRLAMLVLLMVTPQEHPLTFVIVLVAFLFEGFSLGGVLIAFQTARLQLSPRENRAMYIGTINVFSMGLAQGIGSFIAWGILQSTEGKIHIPFGFLEITHFHLVFSLSILCGVVAWIMAGKIGGNSSTSFPRLMRELIASHPFLILRAAVRLDKSKDPKVRVRAARRLGALGAKLGLSELAAALEDEDPRVRLAAANALGRIQSEETGLHLQRALENEVPDVQRYAARGLGRIGDETSLRILLHNLHRTTPWALTESISAVGRIGNDVAVLPLIRLFQRTREQWVRQHIAKTLAQLGGDESPDEILQLLRSGEEDAEDENPTDQGAGG